MNAFHLARPRGIDAAAKLPVQRKKKAVPITYSKQPARVMNARGFLQAPLEPDASRSIVIESREQYLASVDKRMRISRTGTK